MLTFWGQVIKEGADEVVKRIREELPDMPVKYTVEEGGHVFDLSVGLDEPWVKEGLPGTLCGGTGSGMVEIDAD